MSRTILYYISGHGYGHARRSAEVIRCLVEGYRDIEVHIATSADAEIFADVVGDRVRLERVALDPGAIEESVLAISPQKTAQQLREILSVKASIVDEQARVARKIRARLIVADIPFLAGDIAEECGLPCLAMGNFTWDWIYEPWFEGDSADRLLVREAADSYAKMAGILKLPFGGRTDMFREVIPIPLIVNQSRRDVGEVRRKIGLEERDGRRVVLVGLRGGISAEMLGRATREAGEFRFLCFQGMPVDAADNVIPVQLGAELNFADLVRVSDAVVSKLGYGTVADCIGASVAILWPKRSGFREDGPLSEETAPYLRHREIPLADFFAGNWREHLRRLLEAPAPAKKIRTDGGEVCAEVIARRCG